METLLFQLLSSTGKLRISLAPEIAKTVAMIESDIADRRPAIREKSIRIKSWHSAFFGARRAFTSLKVIRPT